TSIDGTKMFYNPSDGVLSSSNREDFFTNLGVTLIWSDDIKEGTLIVFDNDSLNMRLWNRVDENNIRQTFEIL
ncbi:MAG: hypothetical protein IKG23_06190, partial [Clostridia bacterium]|nr:hypothetical protein [Clostridia bacterium]